MPAALEQAAQVTFGLALPVWLFFVLLGIGAVATISTLWLQSVQSRQEKQKVDAIESTGNVLAAALPSYLMPLADIKSRLVNAAEPELSAYKEILIQATVGSANNDLFPRNTRCCYFELSGGGKETRKLRSKAYSGRSDKFECVFAESVGISGPYLFNKIIDAKSSELRGELTKEEFHEWNDGLGFRSGIACAVFSGEKTFGMLTWDAQEVAALDQTHLKIAQLLAQDLGTMLAINRSVNPVPSPD
jgi:hypothetical protein